MFRLPVLPRVACHRSGHLFRFIYSSPPTTNRHASKLSEAVREENKDVATMDALLKAVRERSDPTYHNVVPMRSPILWSEALLSAGMNGGEIRPSEAAAPPTSEIPLTPRNMGDSYSEVILPFGSSSELLEKYTNASGGIRTGKLMEHLDSLAGSIAYKHMLGPTVQSLGRLEERGFYIVTASVDRLDMLAPLNPSRDLRLSGQVIYTGRSSMEVAVKMEAIGKDLPEETVLVGRFSMVCRNAATNKAREVNPLIISTPQERGLYALGEHMKQRRQSLAQRSLSKVPPSSAEAADLHAFYLQHGQGREGKDASDHVWMGDTILEKCLLMFPQERNVHQKIFGGYLMRLAYELGFTNASMFTRGHVRFLSSNSISFAQPVPIGSILRLRSQILYTSSSPEYPIIVHVGVKANVVDVRTGTEQTTNDFRFTWCQERGKASLALRQVVPKTYKGTLSRMPWVYANSGLTNELLSRISFGSTEAMLWLEGKRALELGAEIRGSRTGTVANTTADQCLSL
ncbi:unnamed protein product [Cyclocybe aegerita]|uniref:HotDog ACOT-type domain-containing protein n=1 Tax=Cyclocybe aegerita TaxID=1973307 RepID=A0A8S0VR83_CYCAE|nr:unnamed protein product [Cyclocybe aegerita]